MEFNEFLRELSKKDRENYNLYSPIRGFQIYRIIFECLNKKREPSYSDVNHFIIYDKAMKDVLYKYLGTLEEMIRQFIFLNFDFRKNIKLDERYSLADSLSRAISKRNIDKLEITELYKRFFLDFRQTILFLRKNVPDKYDTDKLDKVCDLRNMVMHHKPLLFDANLNSTIKSTKNRIEYLLDFLLPRYQVGLKNEINIITGKTKENIDCAYYGFLLIEE